VLGFLGQSTTAVQHLGAVAERVEPVYGHALAMLAVVYGAPVWGFTLLWLCLAVALTARQVRAGLPFAPTWWSFTFPVGTVVTGTSALASATGLDLFRFGAGLATLGLLTGWTLAAAGTARAFAGRRGTRSSTTRTNRGSAPLTRAACLAA
jgi:tellurite resistance protein TehA-like permease